MDKKILLSLVCSILGVGASTVRRLIKEDKSFPKPVKIGRTLYFNRKSIYVWLSEKADRNIEIGDKLLSAKDIQALTDRSPAWFWMHFVKNKSRLKKSVKLVSRNYWVASELYSDKEMAKYLEVAKEVQHAD